MRIGTDYAGIGKIQYILGQNRIAVLDSQYTDKVEVSAMIPAQRAKALEAEITEGTNGKASIELGEEEYYGILEGEVIRF